MSKIRVSRNGLNIIPNPILTTRGRYQLFTNLEEEEEELQPDFNVNYINKYGKQKIFKCDTPEKKRLHPLCIHNDDPDKQNKKNSRQKKIRNFFNEYQRNVGVPVPLKNRETKKYNPGYKEYRNKYLSFVEKIRENKNKKWIYEHFYLPSELNEKNIKNQYIHSHLLSYTQKQRLRLRGHLSDIIKNIKIAYFENKKKNSSIIQNINLLFTSINIHYKIKFNFNFNNFLRKLTIINNFLKKIKIVYFLNEDLTYEMIKGEKTLNKIFEEYGKKNPSTFYKWNIIFDFLINNKIFNELFIETYYLQFTHRYRKAAIYALIELVNIYKSRINFIYEILRINDLTEEKLTEVIINRLILPCIEKYLFYINYGMINNFENKEAIFETCFEDFYYYQLKQNLHFIVDFLDCDELNFPVTPINSGATSNIFNYGHNKIIKKVNDNTYEKIFFEFFKQCCVNQKLASYSVENYEIKIGKNICGIIMNKIDGMTLMHYYKYWVEQNIVDENFEEKKNILIYNILNSIGNILNNCQIHNFVHRDFNPRNIMVKIDENNNIIQYVLIDFDYSIISFENIFIINYRRHFNFDNIFEIFNNENGSKQIVLTDFAKSIDLFRLLIYFFTVGPYTQEFLEIRNENVKLYDINKKSEFFDLLYKNLYGININKKNIINFFNEKNLEYFEKYFETEKNPIKKFSQYRALTFSGEFFVRKYIFEKFMSNKILSNPFYLYWIKPFIPQNFLEILNNNIRQNISYNINGGNKSKNLIKPNPQKKNLIKLNLQNLLNQKSKLNN